MILTVTVRDGCAPQKIETTEGVIVVPAGESVTAEFTEEQEAALLAAPGHFNVGTDKPQLDHDGDGRAGGSKPQRGRGRR